MNSDGDYNDGSMAIMFWESLAVLQISLEVLDTIHADRLKDLSSVKKNLVILPKHITTNHIYCDFQCSKSSKSHWLSFPWSELAHLQNFWFFFSYLVECRSCVDLVDLWLQQWFFHQTQRHQFSSKRRLFSYNSILHV